MKRGCLALSAVVIATVSGCAGSTRNTESSTTSSTAIPARSTTTSTILTTTILTTTILTTTIPAATTPPTGEPSTVAPTTVAPVTSPVVPAPPGRLPPVDATGEMMALFPTPFAASTSLELAGEISVRLRTSFESAGFSADVGGVSLVPFPLPGDDTAALVIEVRNREDSADDTSPGYDLVILMNPDQSGSWSVTSATRQTICRRGVAAETDPPLCI